MCVCTIKQKLPTGLHISSYVEHKKPKHRDIRAYTKEQIAKIIRCQDTDGTYIEEERIRIGVETLGGGDWNWDRNRDRDERQLERTHIRREQKVSKIRTRCHAKMREQDPYCIPYTVKLQPCNLLGTSGNGNRRDVESRGQSVLSGAQREALGLLRRGGENERARAQTLGLTVHMPLHACDVRSRGGSGWARPERMIPLYVGIAV